MMDRHGVLQHDLGEWRGRAETDTDQEQNDLELHRGHGRGRQRQRYHRADADEQENHRQELIVLDPADELAGQAGAGIERDHQDHQAQARRRRRPAEHGLQIHRQENVQRQDRAPAERMRHHGKPRDAIGQDGERNKRFLRGELAHDKTAAEYERASDQGQNRRGEPRIAHAAEIERQHERGACRHHQHRTGEVELVRPVMARQAAQHGQGQDHGADAEREIPQKDHPPIKMIADPAAQHRPGAARGGEGDGEIGVIFGAILRRGDVAQNHLRDRGQAAAAAALHDAAADQHQHAGRRRRQ